jgi:hypothetical protein
LPESHWYEVVDGRNVLQGDILKSCPIPTILGLDEWPFTEDHELKVEIAVADACVLTQSCDLENDKVEEVLLGQVVVWEEACRRLVAEGNTAAKSSRFLDALVQGNVPGLALLRKHESDPTMPWSIVDFHRLFVLPKATVTVVAEGIGSRLRLIPPYREHLGQAFARYFMRVGLPLDAREFRSEGKVAL